MRQGKLAEQAFRELYIFRRSFYEPSFLHLLISRKALRSLMETPAPVTGSNLLPSVLACTHPLFTRVLCITDLSPTFWSALPEPSETLCPWLESSFCPRGNSMLVWKVDFKASLRASFSSACTAL